MDGLRFGRTLDLKLSKARTCPSAENLSRTLHYDSQLFVKSGRVKLVCTESYKMTSFFSSV